MEKLYIFSTGKRIRPSLQFFYDRIHIQKKRNGIKSFNQRNQHKGFATIEALLWISVLCSITFTFIHLELNIEKAKAREIEKFRKNWNIIHKESEYF